MSQTQFRIAAAEGQRLRDLRSSFTEQFQEARGKNGTKITHMSQDISVQGDVLVVHTQSKPNAAQKTLLDRMAYKH